MDNKRIEKLRNIEENRKSAQETKETMTNLIADYLPPHIKEITKSLDYEELNKKYPQEMAQAKKRMENSRTPPPNELIELQDKQRRYSINMLPYGGKKKRKSLKKKRKIRKKTRRKKGGIGGYDIRGNLASSLGFWDPDALKMRNLGMMDYLKTSQMTPQQKENYEKRMKNEKILEEAEAKQFRRGMERVVSADERKGGGPAISVLPSIKETLEQINQVFEQPPRQPSLKPHSKPIVLEAAEGLLKLSKGKKGGKRKGRKSLKKKKTKRRKTRKN